MKKANWLPIVLTAAAAFGQQKVPFSGGIPVAPQGLAGKKLPLKPVTYDTGEGQKIRVSVMTRGLENPFGIAFLPTGEMLVTERKAQLRLIRAKACSMPSLVEGGPWATAQVNRDCLERSMGTWTWCCIRTFGTQNKWIYSSYTKPTTPAKGLRRSAVGRGWDEAH